MGRSHAKLSAERAALYGVPCFGDMAIGDISRQDLKAFSIELATRNRSHAPPTPNRIVSVGRTALRWAFENDLVSVDPTEGLSPYSNATKKRGGMTPEERRLLSRWPGMTGGQCWRTCSRALIVPTALFSGDGNRMNLVTSR